MTDRAEINLHHGDCMEAMSKMQDNQYDLAIVDPPYGIKPTSNFGVKETVKFSKEDVQWDTKPNDEYFKEIQRVSNNQIIWGGNYFELPPTRCFLIWDKENGKNPFADCEYAWTSFRSSARIFRFFWLGSHIHRKENVIHPTQKPASLYQWILTNYAKEDDTILDTHGGSMSIAIACWDLKYNLDLWELDKDYFDAGCERFNNHAMQGQFNF